MKTGLHSHERQVNPDLWIILAITILFFVLYAFYKTLIALIKNSQIDLSVRTLLSARFNLASPVCEPQSVSFIFCGALTPPNQV